MAFRKSPAYLWQHPSGLWYFKRPIPPEIQQHFPTNAKGRLPTHIVESLGTHNRAEAERLKRPHASAADALFRRLASGAVSSQPTSTQRRLAEIRSAMAEVHREGADEDAVFALQDMAQDLAERLELEQGPEAAELAYRTAIDPTKRTLKEHLSEWLPTSGLTKQTQQDHRRVAGELLAFLGLEDCLPDSIGEGHAVSYVEMLNAGTLSLATKKVRMSKLGAFWTYLGSKRAVKRGMVNLWTGHHLTGPAGKSKFGGEEEGDEDARPLTDAEAVLLLTEPDVVDRRKRTYTRSLFRELYAIGLTTGMRLNEICSLRAADVERFRQGLIILHVRKSKTEAGVRSIPVTHPAALRVLLTRAEAQATTGERLFVECVEGGPDNKPSWHVSKAMGRDRERLKVGGGAVFHSTRKNFATLMENDTTINSDHVKRYVGHVLDSVLAKHYSAGMRPENLVHIADAVRYSPDIEQALTYAGSGAES